MLPPCDLQPPRLEALPDSVKHLVAATTVPLVYPNLPASEAVG